MTRGEIYWVDFDPARGGEIRKRRPTIVVSNDAANGVMNRVQVVPLTTNTTRVYPGEAPVNVHGRQQKAIASQLRTVAKERLTGFVGSLDAHDLRAVEDAIVVQLGLGYRCRD